MTEISEDKKRMTTGISRDLFHALRRLRMYASLLLGISLFFLLFSLITFFSPVASLSMYGIVSFTASTTTSLFLLLNRVIYSGKCAQCNLLMSNILNTVYFAIATLFIQELVQNDTRYIVACGVFFTYFLFSILIGCRLLGKVQMLAKEDQDDDENKDDVV